MSLAFLFVLTWGRTLEASNRYSAALLDLRGEFAVRDWGEHPLHQTMWRKAERFALRENPLTEGIISMGPVSQAPSLFEDYD